MALVPSFAVVRQMLLVLAFECSVRACALLCCVCAELCMLQYAINVGVSSIVCVSYLCVCVFVVCARWLCVRGCLPSNVPFQSNTTKSNLLLLLMFVYQLCA